MAKYKLIHNPEDFPTTRVVDLETGKQLEDLIEVRFEHIFQKQASLELKFRCAPGNNVEAILMRHGA